MKSGALIAERIISDFRTGSSLPVLVETTNGLRCVVKWKCTGEGPLANAVDWICLHLARQAGITVPTPRLIMITPALVDPGRDPDINDLINRSLGINLGLEFIEEATPFRSKHVDAIDPALRNLIYLFDLLFLNIDRIDANPNMFVSRKQLYCIDFAAAMSVRMLLTAQSYSEQGLLSLIRRHPFYMRKASIDHTGDLVDDAFVAKVVSSVHDEWLDESGADRKSVAAGITAILKDARAILERRVSLLEEIPLESAEAVRARTLRNRQAFEQKLVDMDREIALRTKPQ